MLVDCFWYLKNMFLVFGFEFSLLLYCFRYVILYQSKTILFCFLVNDVGFLCEFFILLYIDNGFVNLKFFILFPFWMNHFFKYYIWVLFVFVFSMTLVFFDNKWQLWQKREWTIIKHHMIAKCKRQINDV